MRPRMQRCRRAFRSKALNSLSDALATALDHDLARHWEADEDFWPFDAAPGPVLIQAEGPTRLVSQTSGYRCPDRTAAVAFH